MELIGEIRATQRFLKRPVMPVEELAQKSMQELKEMLQELEAELAKFN
jgi:ribosomal protein L29